MNEPTDQDRLKALDDRISKLKSAYEPEPTVASGHEMANHAWRMVTELVAGLMIGLGIGYGLDTLFGTMPLFLVLFILLGLTAGIRVMMRTAEEVQKRNMTTAESADKDEGD